MKSTKLIKPLALMLVAVMLLAAFPFAALNAEANAEPAALAESEDKSSAAAAKPAEKGGGRDALDDALNAPGTYIGYANHSTTWQWVAKVDYQGNPYLETNNYGIANSCAELYSNAFYMSEGETISFEYWYVTELAHDEFVFLVNGVEVFSGWGFTNGWRTYTYTAQEDGSVYLSWQYKKDASGNDSGDCASIRNLSYSRHYCEYRERAAIAPGCGLLSIFDNTEYMRFNPKTGSSTDHPLYIQTHGSGVMSIDFACVLPDDIIGTYKLEFDYSFVESANEDSLILRDNNTQILSKPSDELPSKTWAHYSYTITSGGMHIFTFEFREMSIFANKLRLDNIRLVQSDDYTDRWDALDALNAEDTQSRLFFNTPKGSSGFDNYGFGVTSNNYGLDNSTAYFETFVNMAAGETLEFDYYVSSEAYGDQFRFIVNRDVELTDYDWTHPEGDHYVFTAPETNGYNFRWEYVKDESLSHGKDRALVGNVKYTGTRNNTFSLDDALNVPGGNLHFTVENNGLYGRGFIPYDAPGGAWSAAMSGNRYYEASTSSVSTTLYNVQQGDKLEFEYFVSAESYDELILYINGSEVFQCAGDSDGWKVHTHTFQTSGTVQVKWSFIKDESVNIGEDCAMIDDVKFTGGQLDLDLINSEYSDLTLHFTTGGAYPFEPVMVGSQCYAVSTNSGVDSSVSYMETGSYLPANTEIEFYYVLSSEENYDWFKFFVNGTEVHRDSGEPGIQIFRWVANTAGNYVFRWEYSKDSSRSVGDDSVMITEVKVGRAGGGIPGDTDGNGTVNIADAILALRHSMGIIALNSEQTARADMNGDGSVNIADAVTILRKAMNLI